MRKPVIPCPECKGAGFVDLPESFKEILSMFNGLNELCAGDVAKLSRDKITVNGWNNRLAKAFKAGLLKRRRDGKFWMYSRTSP